MEFDHDYVNEISRRAEKLVAEGKTEEAHEQGHVIPADQIASMASYVQQSVQVAIQEIIATAKAMGSEVVPVGFLEAIMHEQCTGVRKLWQTIDELDAPIDYGQAPDDLSELEGL
jgi:hypothetical protein